MENIPADAPVDKDAMINASNKETINLLFSKNKRLKLIVVLSSILSVIFVRADAITYRT